MNTEYTRIFLVEDHSTFRESLAFMLEREPDLRVVAQAGSVAEVRETLETLENGEMSIDLSVVDLGLPDGSGTEVIATLRAAIPLSMSVVLSGYTNRILVARAIEAGAAGILHKSASISDLVLAIRSLRAGEQLIPTQQVVEAVRFAGSERLHSYEARLAISKLTPRERDLLTALAEGASDREIAARLYVGVGTVRSHMTHILTKFGVDSRLQALVFAIRHGLVEVDHDLDDYAGW